MVSSQKVSWRVPPSRVRDLTSGGSHDRTDFLPLKAGFSIMALGAMAAYPEIEVKLVPVGLSYFHPHKFRSRAVIEFGPPISVDREFVEQYKLGGAKKREACGKLLEQVHDGLRAVTLRAPDWETMQVRLIASPVLQCFDLTYRSSKPHAVFTESLAST